MTSNPPSSPTLTVRTKTGDLRGRRNEASGLSEFFGIPYAEPPVGPLRFCAPVPKAPWQGLRDAVRFGPASVQIFDEHEGRAEDFEDDPNEVAKGWLGSEDCLTLNVWTPAADGAKRPVMIWIHGGANHLESSRLPIYHGDRLAAKGDIVFVSMNYRLGLFGFLDVTVLGEDARYRSSGLNGILDQALAIDWVHANIAAFGGDPDNMTVAGESAGGMDISWLISSGRLKGKVRRVVPMSNVKSVGGFGETPGGSRSSRATGRLLASQFLDRLGYTALDALATAPVAEIMGRLLPTIKTEDTLFDLDSLFYPCVDPEFTPL
ncbi:MAG: carboxylesterase family protein, partial [Paracoccaceae bacterium]